jgi:hypothetical protein
MKHWAMLSLVSVAAGSIGCCACGDEEIEQAAALLHQAEIRPRLAGGRMEATVPAPPVYRAHSLLEFQLASVDGENPDAPQGEQSPAPDEPDKRPYEHWSIRQGPAYPGDFWHSLGRDAKEFVPMMWDDTKAVVKSPWGWAGLAAVAATGITLNGHHDEQVADHYTREGGELNDFWDQVGDVGGNPGAHFALAGVIYFSGLANGDDESYGKGKMMLSALAINGITTLALKAAARTESPNGDEFGWPSGHTSSSFCMAATLYEAYGPWVGLPAYAFAGFVGYERIDARNHDFSDVVSGAILGMTIGHLVAKNHEPRIAGMTVLPYTSPSGAVGIALYKEW